MRDGEPAFDELPPHERPVARAILDDITDRAIATVMHRAYVRALVSMQMEPVDEYSLNEYAGGW